MRCATERKYERRSTKYEVVGVRSTSCVIVRMFVLRSSYFVLTPGDGVENFLFLIPLMPLLAFTFDILLGKRFIGKAAHIPAWIAMAIAFGASVAAAMEVGRTGEALNQTLWRLDAGGVPGRLRYPADDPHRPAQRDHDLHHHRDRLPDSDLLRRLHGPRRGLLPLLRLSLPLRLLDARPGPRR